VTPAELEKALENETFDVVSSKMAEIGADMMSALTGSQIKAKSIQTPALDYYEQHVESRLKWLKTGDPFDNRLPCIDDASWR